MAEPKVKFNPKAKFEVETEDAELNEALPWQIEQMGGVQTPEQGIGMLEVGSNVLDIAGAPVRSLLHGGVEGLKKFGSDFVEHPMEAISKAPTGKDIASKAGVSTEETLSLGPEWTKFSPAGAVGLVTEIATDPFSFISPKKITKPIKLMFKRGKTKQASKLISKNVKPTKFLKEGTDPEILAMQAIQEDLGKYLDKPEALLNKLRGRQSIKEIDAGVVTGFKQGSRDGGLIKEASEAMDEMIEQVASNVDLGVGIPRNAISSNISYQLTDKMMRGAGEMFDPKQIEHVENIVRAKFLKTTNEIGINTPNMTLKELHTLKRELGKRLKSREFYKGADEAIQFEKEIDKMAVSIADNLIKSELDKIPVKIGKDTVDAGVFYQANNARLSSLIKLADTVEDAKLQGLKGDDLIAKLRSLGAMGIVGTGAGAVVGAPMAGMAMGGAYSGVRHAAEYASKTSPSASMKWFDKLEKGIDPALNVLPQVQRMSTMPQEDRFGRSPNSVGRAIDEASEEVMNTPLPRDAQQILDSPQHMLMKVAQMMPEKYDEINHILTKRPDLFRKTLPMLVNAMPQLFELDDYNRIDGKIKDPQLRTKAEQDLWKRDDIPVSEKVEINDMLNKDGSYPL